MCNICYILHYSQKCCHFDIKECFMANYLNHDSSLKAQKEKKKTPKGDEYFLQALYH